MDATTTRTSTSVHFEDTHWSDTSTIEHDDSTDSYHSANGLDEGMLARLRNVPPSVAARLSPAVLTHIFGKDK